MKNKLPKIYLAGFSIFLLLALILISATFWNNFFRKSLVTPREDLLSKFTQKWQEKKPAKPEVSLSLNPETDIFAVKKNFEVAVEIDSRGKEIWGTDLGISFDPTQVKIDKVQAGDYIPQPLVLENRVDKEKGVINFSVGTLQAAQGKGVLVVFQVQPLKEGETTISFLPQTQVAMKGKEESAVIEFHNFKFTILGK